MKTFFALLILIMSTLYISNEGKYKITSKYNCPAAIEKKGRCTGSAYCTACSNCSRCAHCSNGGSCGVCSPSETYYTTKTETKEKKNKSSYKIKPIPITKTYYKNESIIVYNQLINLREKPTTKSKIIQCLSTGDEVLFIESTDDWIKVKVKKTGLVGYIYSKLLKQ